MAIKKKAADGAAEEKIVLKPENIKVDRAKEFEKSIAFDATLFGCIKVYGLTYRTYQDKKTGEDKGIISMPSHKGKDEKYYNWVYFFVSEDVLAHVEKEIEALI